MSIMKIFLVILVFFTICFLCNVSCHAYIEYGRHHSHGLKDHVHEKHPPCEQCPRHGVCVSKVQCPAHVRPGSYNPACHKKGTNFVGVCCFTGSGHAAESERVSRGVRTSSSVGAEELKASHHQSKQKVTQWYARAGTLLEHHGSTIVNSTSPSFSHHLSLLTYDKRVDGLGRGAVQNLFATLELKSRQAITDDEIALGWTDYADAPFCPTTPACSSPPSRYRSIGGECNNPIFASWGAVNTGVERLLPPDYSDGVWAMRMSKSGLPLPSARAVSSALLLEGNHPSLTHNMMFMQYGQFIAHDISAAVVFSFGNGSAISCCTGHGEGFLPPELTHWACAPIGIDRDDPFYSNFGQVCLNFVRAQLTPAPDCSVGYAKQMNGATHFPDLSHLYGSSADKLISMKSPGGLLKTFQDYGRDLPPLTMKQECLTMKEGGACFESGDNHGNQVISLTVLHTIWTREHNRIARALIRLNPHWNEDIVFMEARRIVQAEFQHIIYNEWLPLLLGPDIMVLFDLVPSPGYSSSYDQHTNPSLTAEFSTAAMRFGHSVVDGKIVTRSPKSGELYETIAIPEVMFQPSRLRLRRFLDQLLSGLTWQPMQTVDPFVTEGLTSYLFRGGNPYGIDLAAINVQRSRDYGVRSYNNYRRLCGLEPFLEFSQFPPSAMQRLASVYETPEDIDLWVGGLLEEPVEGGIVGPTFAHIIADQFARLKKGDSYFYDYGPDVNPGAMTPAQLAEIKKVTLSRVICENGDGIELVSQPPEAFLRADLQGNNPVPCDSSLIQSMDLSRFKET